MKIFILLGHLQWLEILESLEFVPESLEFAPESYKFLPESLEFFPEYISYTLELQTDKD